MTNAEERGYNNYWDMVIMGETYNPYTKDSPEAKAWQAGFNRAKAEEAQNE